MEARRELRTEGPESLKGRLYTVARVVGQGLVIALVLLLLLSLTSRDDVELAERVDRNAEISRSGVAAIVCILQIDPLERTDSTVNECLHVSGFVGVVPELGFPKPNGR